MKYEFDLSRIKKEEGTTKLKVVVENHVTGRNSWLQIRINNLPVVAICPGKENGHVWIGGVSNENYDWESIGLKTHPDGNYKPVHESAH